MSFAPALLPEMLRCPYVAKYVATSIAILLLLLHNATAGPVTLGTSSASVAASMNGTSINPLVFVLPLVGAAVCVLLLGFCCTCQRRRNLHLNKASKICNKSRSDHMYHGLGIVHSSTANGVCAHLSDPRDYEMLPPYTPRPGVSTGQIDMAPAANGMRQHSHIPAILVLANKEEVDGQKLLSPPAPLMSRTCSPSLQIWSPQMSPSFSRPHHPR